MTSATTSPQISKITPDEAVVSQEVKITGEHLATVVQVDFIHGATSVPAASFHVINTAEVDATVPKLEPDTYQVQVVTRNNLKSNLKDFTVYKPGL